MNFPESPMNVSNVDLSKSFSTFAPRIENGKNSLNKLDAKQTFHTNIEDLPVLLIEYILSHLNYKQILKLRLLSKFWDGTIQDYLSKADRNFMPNLSNFHVQWVPVKLQFEDSDQPETDDDIFSSKSKKIRTTPKISPRLYHLACYVNNHMYIYGGCTSISRAYNDLWRFDVFTKKWLRIIPSGDFPLPRVFPSLTLYNCKDEITGQTKQYLVLFGGVVVSMQMLLPLGNQILDTIHFFDIETNRWTMIEIEGTIRLKSCSHAASIIDDELIVSKGFIFNESDNSLTKSSKVFIFDLKQRYWRVQATTGYQEFHPPRSTEEILAGLFCRKKSFSNSFIVDDHNILFIEFPKCNRQSVVTLLKRVVCRNDSCQNCKQLSLNEKRALKWQWVSIDITGIDFDPKCGGICQIGNLLAYFTLKNEYVPGKSSNFFGAISNISNISNSLDRRLKRLEYLDFYETYFRSRLNPTKTWEQRITHQLNLLDISNVSIDGKINKIEPRNRIDCSAAPKPFCHYSVVSTPDSLILFGSSISPGTTFGPDSNIINRLFLVLSKPEKMLV